MNKETAFEQAQHRLDAPTRGHNGDTDAKSTRRSEKPIDEVFEIERQLASVPARARWQEFERAPPASSSPLPEKNPRKPFGELDEHPSVAESVADGNEKESPPPPLTGYQRVAAELISKSANFLTHSSANVHLGVSLLAGRVFIPARREESLPVSWGRISADIRADTRQRQRVSAADADADADVRFR
ncbi:hypothetical protein PGT21_031675 [Puccinia graminis f. sp. tritici]|uniref:Uncharacterized protein n=1 Tax=Puccinia graminis f. sp. tritici TaxID=56615 RepID=A0A5B0LRK5_PUCGR|nr:hypothetical protein PGT21_031675 [Puccinia graminis f. sp. tritici]